ncbi:MAG: hypothetical protein RL095_2610 [Verrucomicrobiota bacterium]|jgi:hypothetical protein
MRRLTIALALTVASISCQNTQSLVPFESDAHYFSESPFIQREGEGYTVQWRYGEWEFYFRPTRAVVNGQLHLWVQVSTSTGDARGKMGSIKIEDTDEIHALETGGAFWINPDGSKIAMEIRRR